MYVLCNPLCCLQPYVCVRRQLLLALLSKQQEILAVGTALHARFMQPDAAVAADEFLLCTAAMRYGFVKEIQRRTLPTFIRADRERRRIAAQQQQHGSRKQQLQRQLLRKSSRRHSMPVRLQQQQQVEAVGLALQRSRRQMFTSRRFSSASDDDCEAHSSGSRGSSCSLQRGEYERSRSRLSSAAGPQQGSEEARTMRRRMMQQTSRTGSPERCAGSTRRTAAPGEHTARQRLPPGQPVDAGSAAAAAAAGAATCSMSTRSVAAAAARSAAAAAVTARSKEDEVVGYGVLLDSCPTLALFHPTHTRHPHTWHNFTTGLVCDVHAQDTDGNSGTKLSLLQALGLAKPNCAWFFRKVAVKREAAQSTLLRLLQLLWQDKPLPRNLASIA
jgi:hypothetical protein